MPSRRAFAPTVHAPATAPPPPVSATISQFRQDVRWAQVSHFLTKFGSQLGVTGWDVEVFEKDLDPEAPSTAMGRFKGDRVEQAVVELLYALTFDKKTTRDSFEEKLIQQYKLRSVRTPFRFDTDGNPRKRWYGFTPSDKLQVLYDLCEWQLATDGRFRALVTPAGGPAEEAAELRLEPCGTDRDGNTYWFFADRRLWVQHPEPKPPKPEPKPKKAKVQSAPQSKRSTAAPKGRGAGNSKGKGKAAAAATTASASSRSSRRHPIVEELVREDLGLRSSASSRKRGRRASPSPEPEPEPEPESTKGRSLRSRASTSTRTVNPYATSSSNSDKRQRTGLRSSRRLRGDPDEGERQAGSEDDDGWEQPPAEWLEEEGSGSAKRSPRASIANGKGKGKGSKGKAPVTVQTGSDSELSELSELSSLEDEEPAAAEGMEVDTEQRADQEVAIASKTPPPAQSAFEEAKPDSATTPVDVVKAQDDTSDASKATSPPKKDEAETPTNNDASMEAPVPPTDDKPSSLEAATDVAKEQLKAENGEDHAANGTTKAEASAHKADPDAEKVVEAKADPAADVESDQDDFASVDRKDFVQVEAWKARHRTFLEWEAVCISRWDWEHFPERFKTSKDKNERALYQFLTEEAGPEAIDAFKEKEIALAKEEALANRKRSSRILMKEIEREEQAKQEAAKREFEERMQQAEDERNRLRREEEEREARERDREYRLKEREERLRHREELQAQKEMEEAKAREEAERARERRLRRRELAAAGETVVDTDDEADEEAKAEPPVEAEEEEEPWELDCEICYKSGWNLEETQPIACCESCGRWQHINCHNRADDRAGRPRRDWDNVDFYCQKCRQKAARNDSGNIATERDAAKGQPSHKQSSAQLQHSPTGSAPKLHLTFSQTPKAQQAVPALAQPRPTQPPPQPIQASTSSQGLLSTQSTHSSSINMQQRRPSNHELPTNGHAQMQPSPPPPRPASNSYPTPSHPTMHDHRGPPPPPPHQHGGQGAPFGHGMAPGAQHGMQPHPPPPMHHQPPSHGHNGLLAQMFHHERPQHQPMAYSQQPPMTPVQAQPPQGFGPQHPQQGFGHPSQQHPSMHGHGMSPSGPPGGGPHPGGPRF